MPNATIRQTADALSLTSAYRRNRVLPLSARWQDAVPFQRKLAVDAYRFSSHIEASCAYLSYAIGIAEHGGADDLASRLRELTDELHRCDPTFVSGERSRPYKKEQPRKIDRIATVGLLIQLREQHPDAANTRLAELLAEQGHHTRNGSPFSGQHVCAMLAEYRKRKRQEPDEQATDDDSAWAWKDVA
jgi:hypothetical protein